jgi:NAD(P)-dependent dehydrogenase (short-subunit alcohol dehydrogenase family)
MRLGRIASVAALGAGALYVWRQLQQRRDYASFSNSIVVITGGSRGLGLAIAREFAKEGARLALLARDDEELERARQDILARGAEVITISCDVRDEAQVNGAIDQVVERMGRVDVLVNNAGIITVGPQEHMAISDYEDAMATHLWGPLYAMRVVTPHMRRRGGGRIVNISSIGGKVPFPHLAPYVTSKFALTGLSQAMRAELSKDGIAVTTVCPMTMRTGSQYGVQYKGRRGSEMNWFAVLGALPFTSVDAGHSAHLIVEACRHGDAELFVVPPARFAAVLAQLFPDTTARLLSLINSFLPAPAGEKSNHPRRGWDVRAPLAPSTLTALSDRATEDLNQLGRRAPVVRKQEVIPDAK